MLLKKMDVFIFVSSRCDAGKIFSYRCYERLYSPGQSVYYASQKKKKDKRMLKYEKNQEFFFLYKGT